MNNIAARLHLYGPWRLICFFIINHFLGGTNPCFCAGKRLLLSSIGCHVGRGTTIVGPIMVYGTISIGENCWINRDFTVHGNGHVVIGNNCDIAPEVSILTGGHAIGGPLRRAGSGERYTIRIGNGVWVGARSTILGNTVVGDSSVIAACACVNKDIPPNSLVGGIPARLIRILTDDNK